MRVARNRNLSGTASVFYTRLKENFGTGDFFVPYKRRMMMQQMTGLDYKIQEMAARIRELREIQNLTVEQMALKTDVTVEEYISCEEGKSDLNFGKMSIFCL